MRRPQYGIRTLIVFVTMSAFLLTTHRFPHKQYSLPNIFGMYPEHCHRQPWVIYRGWPMYSRTDVTALHAEHDTGPCKYDSTYHPIGLVVNSTLAITLAAIATCLILSGPGFWARHAALRRERAMIDAAVAER